MNKGFTSEPDIDLLSKLLKESIENRKEAKKHFQTPNFKQPTSYELYKASGKMFNSKS